MKKRQRGWQGEAGGARLLGLIDPDVVEHHPFGEHAVIDALGPSPGAADGHVQEQVKGLVERPLLPAVLLPILKREVGLSIHGHADPGVHSRAYV